MGGVRSRGGVAGGTGEDAARGGRVGWDPWRACRAQVPRPRRPAVSHRVCALGGGGWTVGRPGNPGPVGGRSAGGGDDAHTAKRGARRRAYLAGRGSGAGERAPARGSRLGGLKLLFIDGLSPVQAEGDTVRLRDGASGGGVSSLPAGDGDERLEGGVALRRRVSARLQDVLGETDPFGQHLVVVERRVLSQRHAAERLDQRRRIVAER